MSTGLRASAENRSTFTRRTWRRKFGEDVLVDEWLKTTVARFHHWGVTTGIGRQFAKKDEATDTVPYMTMNPIAGSHAKVSSGFDYWGQMHDPFDPEFATDLDTLLEQLKPVANDPWFVGYYIDNELSWQGIGPEADIGLALGTLKAAAGQPAKAAFVADLRKRYGDVQRLNGAWQSQFRDWNELNGPWIPGQVSDGLRRDCRQFVQQFARQYFRVVSEHVKAHDPNHLYCGCRFSVHTEDIVRAAAEYCDVISFNIYAPQLQKAKWAYLATLNKPCLVSEFHIGATDRGNFGYGLVGAGSGYPGENVLRVCQLRD